VVDKLMRARPIGWYGVKIYMIISGALHW
jgi:hypothetical protein